MFKEIANGAKIQVLPIIPIYAKVSKRRLLILMMIFKESKRRIGENLNGTVISFL
jgi:hypothetical protein